MYKFKASQFYKVNKNGISIRFDYFGEYNTDKEEEIEVLKSLCPTYISCVECPEKQEKQEKVEVLEVEPEQEGELPAEPVKCIAKTKAGKPCKNEAAEDSDFCKSHQK